MEECKINENAPEAESVIASAGAVESSSGLAAPLSGPSKTPVKKKKLTDWKDLIFYILMVAFPVAQFCVFYIGVNANSLALAFQKIENGVRVWSFSTLGSAIKEMTTDATMLTYLKNSIVSYLIINAFSIPLGLLFSYYIYRKLPLSQTIRVLLFMPSIISSIIMATMFRYFVNDAIPEIMRNVFNVNMTKGLLDNMKTQYGVVIFYNIWVGFGVSVLMYSNAMSGISPEVVEAAQLDGANSLQEFWHVTLPSIYPTITTFLIVGVAGIFTNQIHLFSFFANTADADVQTMGYYLFVQANKIKRDVLNNSYTDLAAKGVLLTVIAVPLTYLVKWLLEKFGPKED